MRTLLMMAVAAIVVAWGGGAQAAQGPNGHLCLDDICIGQSIKDKAFSAITWLVPKDAVEEKCTGIGCAPEVAFKGYPADAQQALAEAMKLSFGTQSVTIVQNRTLAALRTYAYECNPSPRTIWGERRFMGLFRTVPSGYVTVVGFRLIDGELKVYRIARQYPYRNNDEIRSLARNFASTYGSDLLLYDYLSSNAFSDVIAQGKDGWFGRSTLFNPSDMADNNAELVLVDPRTRPLLEASSMPDSGEIKPLPVRLPQVCARAVPLH